MSSPSLEGDETLGAAVSDRQALPEHGVTVVFVDTGNSKVELLEPLGEASPIAAFLAKNPAGYCGIGGTGVVCPIGIGVDA